MFSDNLENSDNQEPRKSFFKYLTPEERIEIESHLTRVQVKRNEIIYQEGDKPHGFITLEIGRAHV